MWKVTPRTGYAMAGPRSLALATVGGAQRLFVLNRLDNTVAVFPVLANGGLGTQLAQIGMQDPFPIQHRFGQSLLYDARLSGTGKVSCASCHIDARTDALAWRLDTAGNPPTPIPPALLDGVNGDDPNVTMFPGERGPMITQSLQGLRPHPVEVQGADLAPLLTTEPFYWRGARANFEAFGPAFANLMGGSVVAPDAMTAFREFAFGIMYPPNPEQPIGRVFGGSLGTPGVTTDGFGALRGLKLFHERSLVQVGASGGAVVGAGNMTRGRSCVQCHALPTGTNNRITISRLDPVGLMAQPIKSAQLRGLRQREDEHVGFGYFGSSDFSGGPFDAKGAGGLFHDGFARTINGLIHFQFTPAGDTGHDVTEFVRELDTGVAPIVGLSVSATSASVLPMVDVALQIGEAQAEAGNAGLVVRRRVGGSSVDLFYNVIRRVYTDPTNPASTTTVFTRAGIPPAQPLLPPSLSGTDLIVIEAVPVGSERRIAAPTGQLLVQANTAPTITSATCGLSVQPMWEPILQLSGNLGPPGAGFNWTGANAPPKSVLGAAAFRTALAGTFGVPAATRHEAPRRIRITGTNIQLGAKLELRLPVVWGTVGGVPTPQAWASATFDLNPVQLASGLVFETSATIDPLTVYAMLCGWIAAPGVQATLDTGTPAPASLNPAQHNVFELRVHNENPGAPATSTTTTSLRML